MNAEGDRYRRGLLGSGGRLDVVDPPSRRTDPLGRRERPVQFAEGRGYGIRQVFLLKDAQTGRLHSS